MGAPSWHGSTSGAYPPPHGSAAPAVGIPPSSVMLPHHGGCTPCSMGRGCEQAARAAGEGGERAERLTHGGNPAGKPHS